MPSLEHRNNRDNCHGNITHGQPIGKQISYRPYKRIASFDGYFYKEDFLDWLLDLEDLFDFEYIYYERKIGLVLYILVSMLYVGGNEYNLIESNKIKIRFVHGQG